jgi:hypothetical protein
MQMCLEPLVVTTLHFLSPSKYLPIQQLFYNAALEPNAKDCMRNEENNNPLDNKNYSFQ